MILLLNEKCRLHPNILCVFFSFAFSTVKWITLYEEECNLRKSLLDSKNISKIITITDEIKIKLNFFTEKS